MKLANFKVCVTHGKEEEDISFFKLYPWDGSIKAANSQSSCNCLISLSS